MCHLAGAVIVAVAHEYLSRRTPPTRLPRAGGVGYRREAARLAGGGPRGLPGQRAARLPRRGHPGCRQDHLRPADRRPSCSTAASSGPSPWSPPPSTSSTSGPTRPAGSASTSTRRSRTPRGLQSHEYDGVALTYAQVASKPQLHRRRTEETPTLRHPRRDPPRRRRAVVGRRHPRGLRAGRPAAVAHRHAVPLRHQPDPVRALRDGRGRHPALGVRLLLRLCRGAAGRRRAAGAVPGLRRRDALAHQGRRRGRRPAGRAPHQGPDGAGLAHCARPQGGVGALGAGGRRHTAERGAPPRAGCRRPGDRLERDLGARLRQHPAHHHRRGPHRRAVRRRRRERRHRVVRHRHLALAGGGADGVRGGRRAPAVRRGLRHLDLDAAVLRAGGRPLRAGPPARRDGVGLPALGAGHPHPRRDDGGGARPRAEPVVERRGRGLAGRRRRDCSRRRTAPSRPSDPRTPRSRRSRATPTSTTCSSTPSSSACTRPWARRRSRTTSACPACSSPTRWPPC